MSVVSVIGSYVTKYMSHTLTRVRDSASASRVCGKRFQSGSTGGYRVTSYVALAASE